jgi:hypothetical protein
MRLNVDPSGAVHILHRVPNGGDGLGWTIGKPCRRKVVVVDRDTFVKDDVRHGVIFGWSGCLRVNAERRSPTRGPATLPAQRADDTVHHGGNCTDTNYGYGRSKRLRDVNHTGKSRPKPGKPNFGEQFLEIGEPILLAIRRQKQAENEFAETRWSIGRSTLSIRYQRGFLKQATSLKIFPQYFLANIDFANNDLTYFKGFRSVPEFSVAIEEYHAGARNGGAPAQRRLSASRASASAICPGASTR